ncbi:MAG: hypothetical protein F6J97_25100 [Leptolyngbya sp. SIO4C1]|nr:hypothetical protein [Leptolyngbya sp. SIO4C1]
MPLTAPAPASASTLHYRLTPSESGVTLQIWEPAQKTAYRRVPYYFFITYQLASVEAAQQVLDQYLINNDVAAVCNSSAQSQPLKALSRSQTYG